LFSTVANPESELSSSAMPPGGGSVPPVELRVARLEVRVEHIERDISEIKTDLRALRAHFDRQLRAVWASIIASNLGLAGLMAKGFGWL
jgi:hypothetical protein